MDRQYVVFRLEGQSYGADITVVREVGSMLPVTRLPNTPDYVDGVLDLRGEVLPVIDLRRRLGLPTRPADQETRVMILDLGHHSSALVVDGVEHVITVQTEAIMAPESQLILPGQDFVTGVARSGDHLVIIMDLKRLMDSTRA